MTRGATSYDYALYNIYDDGKSNLVGGMTTSGTTTDTGRVLSVDPGLVGMYKERGKYGLVTGLQEKYDIVNSPPKKYQ